MRRKRHEEHTNHEAWAIPYADLMTLLLAFFVVMYAVSVVNEGKYRVMSESIIEAFHGSSHVIAPMPSTRAAPHNVDPAIAAPASQPGAASSPVTVPIPSRPSAVRRADARAPQSQQQNLARIQDQVARALQPLIDRKLVRMRRTANWLEIEIRTDILFPSGVAQLAEPADAVLGNLAAILAPFSNPLRVEGYTDDKPINTAVFPSNWELSAARAASVARLFAEHGVSPERLGIIGWGQFRPVADNATAEGRNRNRRVLVVVLSDKATPTRFYSDAAHADQLAADPSAAPPAASPAAAAPAGVAVTTPGQPGLVLPAIRAMHSVAAPHAYAAGTGAGAAAPIAGAPTAPMVVTPDSP